MHYTQKNCFVCPACKGPLTVKIVNEKEGHIINGELICNCGNCYQVKNSLPDFTYPAELSITDRESKSWYDANADVYDEYLPLTFRTFNEDEAAVRSAMVAKLNLQPSSKVLEVGAGTGRDSVFIAKYLSEHAELHLQDLCHSILEKSFPKLENIDVPVIYHLGNACWLPYPDNYFDAAFHFGGLNTFSDIKKFLEEMNRVTKKGGKVVIGDESMPEWLRDTEFGKILMNSNPHYKYMLPFRHLPVSCRKVNLEWIIGGV
ncbi:MAG: methyltransferase domain-containing protein, partial [Lamprobacter sp.]|uniref:methyltransferase domain-containing protein n=1 Tax=Lamprobacter sp. TaxID=3100796 RepID=UPI002B261CAC